MARPTPAFFPTLIADRTPAWDALACLMGVLILSALAQIALPLPWTPVPITGQTFGVTLLSLLLGRKLAMSSVAGYLALGLCGLPIFALGAAGSLTLGPTSGYLIGMLASSVVVGTMANRGYARSFRGALLAGVLGSLTVYAFGLLGLSVFIPGKQVFTAGMLPFLPGDAIKTTLAALIASRSYRTLRG